MKKFLLLTILCLFLTTPPASASLVTKTLKGQDFNLEKMRGKVVVVNLWAEWCANCQKEMLILEELYREHHASGLEIIGISIDPQKSRPNVLKRTANLTYPNSMLIDATFSNFSEINSVPTNYIFDRTGKLQAVSISEATPIGKQELEELLRPLLKTSY